VHLEDLFKIINFDEFLLEVVEKVHFGVQLLLLLEQQLHLLLLLLLKILQKLDLVLLIFELFVRIGDLLALPLVDEYIIEVAKVGQLGDEMSLILAIPFSILDSEGVAVHI
jgi:hypothetical protein